MVIRPKSNLRRISKCLLHVAQRRPVPLLGGDRVTRISQSDAACVNGRVPNSPQRREHVKNPKFNAASLKL